MPILFLTASHADIDRIRGMEFGANSCLTKPIGADALFYNTIENLRNSVRYGNPKIGQFSEGCFTGKYPTPEITPRLLKDLGCGRNATREAFDQETAKEENPDQFKMMSLV